MVSRAKNKITLGFALFVSFTLVPFPSLAAEVSIQGRPTPRTPFDHKLRAAGLLDSASQLAQVAELPSVEKLFRIARSFRYTGDAESADNWQTPRETEAKRSGDCEDKAIWLYDRLKHYGYQNVRLVIGKYRRFENTYHVWVKYTTSDNQTYILDPAIQKRIWPVELFSPRFYEPYFSVEGDIRYRHRGFPQKDT